MLLNEMVIGVSGRVELEVIKSNKLSSSSGVEVRMKSLKYIKAISSSGVSRKPVLSFSVTMQSKTAGTDGVREDM